MTDIIKRRQTMAIQREIAYQRELLRVQALKSSGYSNAYIAELMKVPESRVRGLVAALEKIR